MEVVLLLVSGFALGAGTLHWFHSKYLRSPTVKDVRVDAGGYVILDTRNPSLKVHHALWGDEDITKEMQDYCEDCPHVEFVVNDYMIGIITHDRITKDVVALPQVLSLRYE